MGLRRCLLFLFCGALTACHDPVDQPECANPYTLSVDVVDSITGRPLLGNYLITAEASADADTAGTFYNPPADAPSHYYGPFQMRLQPFVRYQLTIKAPRYVEWQSEVVASAPKCANGTIHVTAQLQQIVPVYPVQDTTLCEQTYEFGNYGCAQVEGYVLGIASQALAGIYVSATSDLDRAGRGAFTFPVVNTTADGHFKFRVYRMLLPPGNLPPHPDTLSTWIRAARPSTSAVVKDSVFARLEFFPIGTKPVITILELRLPL